MKKILVTGSSGLLGQEILPLLVQAQLEVFALDIVIPETKIPGVVYLEGDLFDEKFLAEIFSRIKPAYLLNLAWKVTGDYANSNLNFSFLSVGLSMLELFRKNGGSRAIYMGSWFEYAPSEHPIFENNPLQENSAYSVCKIALWETASKYCEINGISFLWIRPFQVYGTNEKLPRLTASILDSIRQNKKLELNHASLKRDFIFCEDLARATVKAILSDVSGALNICSGKLLSLEEFAREFFRLAGKEDLLVVKNIPTKQPATLVGDNSKLKKMGFVHFTSHAAAAKIILEKNGIPIVTTCSQG